MDDIGTETAFEVLAKARKLEAQGRNIVHLEIGEPDFPTPPNIVDAAERALHDGYTHYTPAGGLMPVRQAVADWIRRWYEVEVKPRTKLMVINSPQNPTGGVLSTRDLEQIAELAMRHDFHVLSDEVYGQITYDGHHASIMTVPGMLERTIYSDGLSKAYAMCGWRLGFAVAPLPLAQKFETLMINSSSCAAA